MMQRVGQATCCSCRVRAAPAAARGSPDHLLLLLLLPNIGSWLTGHHAKLEQLLLLKRLGIWGMSRGRHPLSAGLPLLLLLLHSPGAAVAYLSL